MLIESHIVLKFVFITILLTTISGAIAFSSRLIPSKNQQPIPRCVDCEGNDLGAIEGVVINNNGERMSGMIVKAEEGDRPKKPTYTTITDKHGKFYLAGLPQSMYILYAGNPPKGYPVFTTSFYSNNPIQQSILVSKSTVTNVTLSLGEKLGILSGRITDNKTNKPISEAFVRLSIEDFPDRFYQTTVEDDGSFKLPIPSEAVTVKVTASGYKDWHFTNKDSSKNLNSLMLKSGQIEYLKISMLRE